jgi:hypothetical protein
VQLYPSEYAGALARLKKYERLQKLQREGAQKIKGEVLRVLIDGVIVRAEKTEHTRRTEMTFAERIAKLVPEVDGTVFVRGHPDQATLADTDKIEVIAKDVGIKSVSGSTLRIWEVIPEK